MIAGALFVVLVATAVAGTDGYAKVPTVSAEGHRCGPYFEWVPCPESKCCSQYGWCGSSPVHCQWCNETNPADCPFYAPEPRSPAIATSAPEYPSDDDSTPDSTDAASNNTADDDSTSDSTGDAGTSAPAQDADASAAPANNDTLSDVDCPPGNSTCDDDSGAVPTQSEAPVATDGSSAGPSDDSDAYLDSTPYSSGMMPTVFVAFACVGAALFL